MTATITQAYPCTCNADQKVGILKGVHSARCKTQDAIYPEVVGERNRGEACGPPEFPKSCPACGAAMTIERDGNYGVGYACGGSYRPKPQIQNHTNYWWGSCGLK